VPAPSRQPLYVYAITTPDHPGASGLTGLLDQPTELVCKEGIAAVVSPLTTKRLRPDRASIAAHQRVLRSLMEQRTVLPLSFGLLASSRAQLEGTLDDHGDELAAHLERVSGKVEMGLRLKWDVPDIFAYFVTLSPELRDARDRMATSRTGPSHEQKMRVGRLFERVIASERAGHASRVVAALGPVCAELVEGSLRSEADVLNLALLVERERLAEFEAAVAAAAGEFPAEFAFEYSGPWAPHSFVTLHLSLQAEEEAAC